MKTGQPSLTVKRSILFICGLLFFMAMSEQTRNPRAFMIRCIGIAAGVGAWMSLAWMVALPSTMTTNPMRPGLSGISNHPNTLAPLFALALVIATGWQARSRIDRIAMIASVAGCLIALPLTNSWSSMGLAVVGVFVSVCLRSRGYFNGLVLIGGLVAGAVVMILGPDAIMLSTLDSMGRDASFSGRDQLWAVVFQHAMERPAFGHGWGAFWVEGRGRELVGTWNPRQSHNAYLDVFVDLGLVGLLLTILAFHAVFIRAWIELRSITNQDERRMNAAILATIFALLAVYGLQQSYFYKVDSFPFIVLLWSVLLLGRGRSGMSTTASASTSESSDAPSRADALVP